MVFTRRDAGWERRESQAQEILASPGVVLDGVGGTGRARARDGNQGTGREATLTTIHGGKEPTKAYSFPSTQGRSKWCSIPSYSLQHPLRRSPNLTGNMRDGAEHLVFQIPSRPPSPLTSQLKPSSVPFNLTPHHTRIVWSSPAL